jgi:putative phosphoesterase
LSALVTRLGVIADTHGLLRPEAVEALRNADHIVHAGDIGKAGIIAELSAIAPVTAIRGNVDRAADVARLPATRTVRLPGVAVHVVHDIADLEIDPAAAGVALVVFGHSHKPSTVWKGGVLYLNPGSAGPRRFRLPVTLATVEVGAGTLTPRLHTLA